MPQKNCNSNSTEYECTVNAPVTSHRRNLWWHKVARLVVVWRLNVPLNTLYGIPGTIFTGHTTRPTVSKHWKKAEGRRDQRVDTSKTAINWRRSYAIKIRQRVKWSNYLLNDYNVWDHKNTTSWAIKTCHFFDYKSYFLVDLKIILYH